MNNIITEAMYVLPYIGGAAGVISAIAMLIIKRSAQTYVDEKAKNLATIEDTAKITREIESVKKVVELEMHQKKELFGKEYEILQNVWRTAWEFQARARRLRPFMDYLPSGADEKREVFKQRHTAFRNSMDGFIEVVVKNRPFIPKGVYDACDELRLEIVPMQVDFEMTAFENIHSPDWQMIRRQEVAIDAKVEKINDAIRKHIYGV